MSQGMPLLVLGAVLLCGMAIPDDGAAENTPTVGAQGYFRANHGYGGGLMEMVDLREVEGFEAAKSIDDLATLAASERRGEFSVHPHFEKGNGLLMQFYGTPH